MSLFDDADDDYYQPLCQGCVYNIAYNYPFYNSIPHLEVLYRPAFPHLLFCGPPFNSTRPGILIVDIIKGFLGYECLGRATRENTGYKGYFYIRDDVILKYSQSLTEEEFGSRRSRSQLI